MLTINPISSTAGLFSPSQGKQALFATEGTALPSKTTHKRPSAAARCESLTVPSRPLYSGFVSPFSRTRLPGRGSSAADMEVTERRPRVSSSRVCASTGALLKKKYCWKKKKNIALLDPLLGVRRGEGSRERERERERESFIRNNLHNGVVSGAARGQALHGPMWAGLTPDSKGDPRVIPGAIRCL